VRKQIGDYVDKLDDVAGNIIFELNKIHASGQGLEGFSNVAATNTVTDPTVALNDPKSGPRVSADQRQLRRAREGQDDGLVSSTLVQVDLDGLGGNDTTLDKPDDRDQNVANISPPTPRPAEDQCRQHAGRDQLTARTAAVSSRLWREQLLHRQETAT
jgi:hypothetical protein